MTRKKPTTLTEFEQRIMTILWDRQEASVREVCDSLSREKPVAYTTILTMLKILKDKGFVAHRKQGKAFIYHPLVNQKEARKSALTKLINQLFQGSPEILAQHLIAENNLDLAEIKALQDSLGDTEEKA
ncbi:MAG: BlaI/MecI/CopY family transcriptional regulator [Alphaproteobacteria bacterium]|nr:BlaI/MecI/CopY family transcriptional regulator [Alphaproteobacteria bacterium]HEC00927.1 BlaI/MecI/CopY family transcriptional regulator [Sphingomonadales bacterium]